MESKYFSYDGLYSKALGFCICSFNGSNSVDEVDTDSQRDWNSISLFNGAYQPFVSVTYSDVLEMEYDIMKDPCEFGDDVYYTYPESQAVKRWLNRPTAHKLVFEEYPGIYFMGSFNVKEVHLNGKIIGFNLTFHSNRPFAIKDCPEMTGELEAGKGFNFVDISDELGFIYPNLELTLKEGGDLTLTNSQEPKRETIVKNCTAGEVLTFTSVQQLYTSVDSHKVLDDFNFRFPRISNTFEENLNTITSNLACSYKLTYEPIAKEMIV